MNHLLYSCNILSGQSTKKWSLLRGFYLAHVLCVIKQLCGEKFMSLLVSYLEL